MYESPVTLFLLLIKITNNNVLLLVSIQMSCYFFAFEWLSALLKADRRSLYTIYCHALDSLVTFGMNITVIRYQDLTHRYVIQFSLDTRIIQYTTFDTGISITVQSRWQNITQKVRSNQYGYSYNIKHGFPVSANIIMETFIGSSNHTTNTKPETIEMHPKGKTFFKTWLCTQ